MDKTLLKAINNLLGRIDDHHLVNDLLLIEVDWGDHTPPLTNEPAKVFFQGRTWPLVYTGSELVLRRLLCHDQAILVFRSGHDNGFEIPRDVRARADQITPHQLGLRDRLYALTDRDWPPEVDYADWRPSIERHLADLVRQAGGAGLQWSITRNSLETMLIEAAFGLKVEGRNAAQLLADLTGIQRKSNLNVTDPSTSLRTGPSGLPGGGRTGPSTLPGGGRTGLEQSLLQGQLRAQQIAWAEVVIWATEPPAVAARAEELIQTGLMMAAEQLAGYLPNWGRLNSLRARLINERRMSEKEAIDGVIGLATEALQHLHFRTRQSIVKAAERAVLPVLSDDAYNPWFPEVLEREIERVAQRLSVRDSKALARVGPLHDHLFAVRHQTQLKMLTHMADLVRRWQEQVDRVDTLANVADWTAWYAGDGARIDLAALCLMEQPGTGLDEPVQQLLEKYWAWRDKLNAAFAEKLLNDYEAALHNRRAGIFGAHRLLRWAVRPILQADRRVLLLIIDGMGCAAFWRLLQEWTQESPPVYAQESEQVRAVLSLLPSVTSVSRQSLFLDALPTDRLDDEQVYEEKARTGEAKALAQAFPDHTVKLYSKTNLGTGQDLLSDIQFQMADVIVAIFNVIDDDLRSTTTKVRLPSLRKDMGLLIRVVRAALETGWAVIMTADHGHTWHRSKGLRRGPIITGGGERFKPMTAGDSPPAGAVVTNDPHIVRVQAGQQVALLTATGAYFGRQPRRGYHGGASLEEVVVPCALLTHEPPATEPKTAAGRVELEKPAQEYDMSGVVLTLPPDGRVRNLDLPFTLSPREVRLLQALAHLGEASEADLKQAAGTHRIAGPMASLQERLATAGPDYEYIEQKGAGTSGTIYRFRVELLK